MNRCFQAPEILRLVCDQLPTTRPEERQKVLAVALSCRALLDPALDRLWHTINGFEILQNTLPSGIWKLETIPLKDKKRTYNLLNLRRAITSDDLERYLQFYAPRIREVHIDGIRLTLSVEAWQSLVHLAVNWRPGALAPRAIQIRWPLAPPFENAIPQDILNQAWPYFTLFLGSSVLSLDFAFRSDCPIQVASLRNAVQHPALKELRISHMNRGTLKADRFIDDFIKSFPWDHLQTLEVGRLSGVSLDHLSTLPRLRSLKVDDLGDVVRLHQYVSEDYDYSPAYISGISTNAFRSLEILDLYAEDIRRLTGVLQRIPKLNQIHTLHCEICDAIDDKKDLREFLATVNHHCNEESLRNLILEDKSCQIDWEECEEIDLAPLVDVTPLFKFKGLEKITINMSDSVCLTPDNVLHIISSWPNLVELSIDVDFPNSRVPHIDHTDFLILLYGCRHLERLGLHFNATQISGLDAVPLSLLPTTQDAFQAAPLVHLNVGVSPIYSPLKVVDFLRLHCPKLFLVRYSFTYLSADDMRSNVFNSMYEDRWCSVRRHITHEL